MFVVVAPYGFRASLCRSELRLFWYIAKSEVVGLAHIMRMHHVMAGHVKIAYRPINNVQAGTLQPTKLFENNQ